MKATVGTDDGACNTLVGLLVDDGDGRKDGCIELLEGALVGNFEGFLEGTAEDDGLEENFEGIADLEVLVGIDEGFFEGEKVGAGSPFIRRTLRVKISPSTINDSCEVNGSILGILFVRMKTYMQLELYHHHCSGSAFCSRMDRSKIRNTTEFVKIS